MININSPYPLIDAIAEGAAIVSKFKTSLIFREFYKLEMESENPFYKRIAQVVQTKIALDFTAKLISHVYSPFSFNWKIHTVCLLIGIIPRLCDLKKLSSLGKAWQKVDDQWNNITVASRILSVAVAALLITCKETTDGLALGLNLGFGFLESKKIIPAALSQFVEGANKVLWIGVFGANVIAGNLASQMILTVVIANQVINYIGHQYYPLNTPITEKDEKNLVASIRGLISSPPTIKSGQPTEHFKWKAIPRFFTLTCPNQTLEKEADLNRWFSSIESEFKDVVDYNWFKIKAKMLFLMRLQMFLNQRCKSIYYQEKNQIILNSSPNDFGRAKTNLKEKFVATFALWNNLDRFNEDKAKKQLEHIYMIGLDERNLFDQFGKNIFKPRSVCFEDQISQIQELEEIRAILIEEIKDLIDENQKKSFLSAIKADGYQKTVADLLNQSVNELRDAYQEFVSTHNFNIKNEAKTFVYLSILGFLQEKRREEIHKELSPHLYFYSEEEQSHFIDYAFGNLLGLQSKPLDPTTMPNYLHASLTAFLLKNVPPHFLKIKEPVQNFCKTLPKEMTESNSGQYALNCLADLQIIV